MNGWMGSQASLDKRLSKLPEIVKDREAWLCCMQSMGSQRVEHDLATKKEPDHQ